MPASLPGSGDRIDQIIKRMTLQEKVGQLFVTYAYGQTADTTEPADVAHNEQELGVANGKELIEKYHLGGVIYFAWDRYDLLNPRETDRKQTVDAQAAALDLMVRQIQTIKPARIDVIGRADASMAADLPVNEQLSFRLSATRQHSSGYMHNLYRPPNGLRSVEEWLAGDDVGP